ncbi:MAG: hypothetical protein AB4368_20080 [Xenococcaceae cyanobacterium]
MKFTFVGVITCMTMPFGGISDRVICCAGGYLRSRVPGCHST